MILFLSALLVFLLSGLAALAAGPAPRWAARIGAGGAVLASGLGLLPVLRVLAEASTESFYRAWSVPYGAFALRLDPLSAFFLLPVLILSALTAVYGNGYLQAGAGRRAAGAPWFFFNLLSGSMALVLVASNGVLFLIAWELMTLASFFLVTLEHEKPDVRQAGWNYLVAAHIGTAFLLALFPLLGQESGSLDFDRFGAPPEITGLLFLLALVGFGTKAGFVPFHVWLPEAHPAAPSHVSALMSGAMIKTGIYGLLRTLTFLGPPPGWWGWLLVGIGLASGLLGILFALAQHDLKRMLAYSSVENVGIIALGLGLGLLGISNDLPGLAVLGLAGGLLHVLNHALFKSLLFLGAGAVLHASGTRVLDRLGGLLKPMPWTGAACIVGAVAISGLPPLNGFLGEFLIYLGALEQIVSNPSGLAAPLIAATAGLALIGGLAAACFIGAVGIAFLGEPRTRAAAAAHEPGWTMRLPLVLLAVGCLAAAGFAPRLLDALRPVVSTLPGLPPEATPLARGADLLGNVTAVTAGFFGLLLLLFLARRHRLSGRRTPQTGTWDCGYARPTPRMQYTASAFAQPITELFGLFLRTRRRVSLPENPFPAQAALATETPDVFDEHLYSPLFRGFERAAARLRWLQHGRVQVYILYIALTLLVLLFWKLG